MTAKEFCTRTNCSDAELGERVNSGWTIHYMQFMADGKLNVVFVRDVTPAPVQQPAVSAQPVTLPRVIVPRPIVSRKLPPNMTVLGIDQPAYAEACKRDTVGVNPVVERARQAAQDAYDRARAEGEERMRQAASSFRPNFNQGVTT